MRHACWCVPRDHSFHALQGAGSAPGPRRQRVLRGRNEREWPEVAPARVTSAARMRDPTAANLSDPYTISAHGGGAARPRAAERRAAAASGASGAEPGGAGGPQRGGTAAAAAEPPSSQAASMPKEIVQRLAAKAPVLPAGVALRIPGAPCWLPLPPAASCSSCATWFVWKLPGQSFRDGRAGLQGTT